MASLAYDPATPADVPRSPLCEAILGWGIGRVGYRCPTVSWLCRVVRARWLASWPSLLRLPVAAELLAINSPPQTGCHGLAPVVCVFLSHPLVRVRRRFEDLREPEVRLRGRSRTLARRMRLSPAGRDSGSQCRLLQRGSRLTGNVGGLLGEQAAIGGAAATYPNTGYFRAVSHGADCFLTLDVITT